MSGDVLLSPPQYAAATGRSLRTVQRYLERGQLEGAVQRDDGRWEIPADATPGEPTTGRDVATRAATSPQPVTLAGALELLPAYVDVETAAPLLGLAPSTVRAHAPELDGRRWGPGPGRAWMIPVAAIRRAAGL